MNEPAAPAATQRRPAVSSPVALRWQIWLPWGALAAILLSATRTDPDLWGHVRFGLDWLAARALPSADPYSFTQDRPWVNHEWLSEAAMAASFRACGPAGLVLLKMTVMAGAIAVLLWRLGGATPLLRAAVATTAIVGTLPLSGTVRPPRIVRASLKTGITTESLLTESASRRHRSVLRRALSSYLASPMPGKAGKSAIWRVEILPGPDNYLSRGPAGPHRRCSRAGVARREDQHEGEQIGGEGQHPQQRDAQRARWTALALVPSSLMLGVTTHISIDLASDAAAQRRWRSERAAPVADRPRDRPHARSP